MRPIFCGNVEYDARQSDLERLFRKYGRVERVDMKSGFAFVYMEDERDAEDAVRGLDQTKFGRKERRLRVEWTKHERGIRRPGGGGDSRRSSANTRPSRTLFVINFDPNNTRTKDLERHFETYGKIVSVRIRRNFAFVQFDSQDDATRALEASNMSKLMDRVISVEYAARDDDEHRNGHSPDRSRDRSRDRSPDRGRDRRRSPSPYRKDRDSPDYGHTSSRSPYRKEKGSSDHRRGRSPSPYKRDRASPESARGTIRSPYRTERAGSDRARDPVRSPYRKERASLENGRGPSRSPRRREKHSAENDRSPSHSPYRRERPSSGNGRGASRSSHGRERERASPEDGHGPSPHSMPEGRDSPYGREVESPINESRSPAGEK